MNTGAFAEDLAVVLPSGRKCSPFLSVIIPVYNEEAFIARALQAVLAQDYPSDRFEIIIADGQSNDQTRAIIDSFSARHENVRLIDNPKRIVSTGLNRAIQFARGEIIVRMDGHCEYPRNYLTRLVEERDKTGADNIGGVLVPAGVNYVQKAVASAYCSKVGFGGYALKGAGKGAGVREVDTVHGGCWRRERLLTLGGFDEQMVRNQDDELSFRLRKHDGRILQILDLRVRYYVRNSFKKLFVQFAQYGFWKVAVIRKHPKQASFRHVVPAAFVTTIVVLLVGTGFSTAAAGTLLPLLGFYLGILSIASITQMWSGQKSLWPGVVCALTVMHVGYGLGFLLGIFRSCFSSLPVRRFFEQTSR